MGLRYRLTMVMSALLLHSLAIAGDFPLDEPLAVDTPASTVAGNPFTAAADWTVSIRGPATIITAPEGGSHLVFVDVAEATDAEAAIAAAWAAYKKHDWPLKVVDDVADGDGWSRQKRFEYQTSPSGTTPLSSVICQTRSDLSVPVQCLQTTYGRCGSMTWPMMSAVSEVRR